MFRKFKFQINLLNNAMLPSILVFLKKSFYNLFIITVNSALSNGYKLVRNVQFASNILNNYLKLIKRPKVL